MAELYLIVRLAGERIAFPASRVEGVVELEAITPVPRAAPHVAGLAGLRSRVLTVIDCIASLGFAPQPRNLANAVIVPLDGHPYALLVDGVEDVIEMAGDPLPLTAPLAPGWARVATGMIEAEGDLLLLVDPHSLVAGTTVLAA